MRIDVGDISWVLDEKGNIVSSRLNHFIDEARLYFDKYDSANIVWYEKFGSQALAILEQVAKNPEKVV